MSDIESDRRLRFDNLTDLFIHDARGAFGGVVTVIPGEKWEAEDYEHAKDTLKGILAHFDEYEVDGRLSRASIEDFLTEAQSQDWNAKTVRKMWEKFNEFTDDVTIDEYHHK